MSLPARPNNSWSLSGSLSEQTPAQLIERCQALRFTGRLRLVNADPALDPTRAEAQWIGGEIVDIVDTLDQKGAADESTLLAFSAGTFQLTQGLPDLDGTLLEQRELTGALRAGLVQRLYELCNRARLSALLTLSNGNADEDDEEDVVDLDGAEVRFNQGRVESATIAGEPQAALQALAALSAWTQGTFRIHLLPLFTGGASGDASAAAAAPVIVEIHREASGIMQAQKPGREFDLTGVGERPRAEDAPPAPTAPAPLTSLAQEEAPPAAVIAPSARTPASGRSPRLPGLTHAETEPPAPVPAAPAAVHKAPAPVHKAPAPLAPVQAEPPPSARTVKQPPPPAAPATMAVPAGPWVRAVVTGVVIGTVAFLIMLGARGPGRARTSTHGAAQGSALSAHGAAQGSALSAHGAAQGSALSAAP